MGICSSQKPKGQCNLTTESTLSQSLKCIEEFDSSSFAMKMRQGHNEIIVPEEIDMDLVLDRIERKSHLLLACYNENTSLALKIKHKTVEYYTNYFIPYKSITSNQLVQKQTVQLLVEALVIINSLLDKKFDSDTQLWWNLNYYRERIALFNPLPQGVAQSEGFFAMLQTLREVTSPTKKPMAPSLATSTAIQDHHMRAFYNEMTLGLNRVP